MDTEQNTIWSRQLNCGEVEQVMGCLEGRDVIPILPAALMPVRTNNLKNFFKDFFFPTTMNQALRVQQIAWKVLALLRALILDALTLPIRVFTCIPRILSNALLNEHPLHRYLAEQGVDENILTSDQVLVQVTWLQLCATPTSLFYNEVGSCLSLLQDKASLDKKNG